MGDLKCSCQWEAGDSDCAIHALCSECGADISHQAVVRSRANAMHDLADLRTRLAAVEAERDQWRTEAKSLDSFAREVNAGAWRDGVPALTILRCTVESVRRDHDTWKARAEAVEAERDSLRITVGECQVVLDRQRRDVREAQDRAQVAEAERDRLRSERDKARFIAAALPALLAVARAAVALIENDALDIIDAARKWDALEAAVRALKETP